MVLCLLTLTDLYMRRTGVSALAEIHVYSSHDQNEVQLKFGTS